MTENRDTAMTVVLFLDGQLFITWCLLLVGVGLVGFDGDNET